MAAAQPKTDVYPTPLGEVAVTPLGHGSVMIGFDGKTIHVDPYSAVADYSKLPKADLVLLTHEHDDHFDQKALDQVVTPGTEVIAGGAVNELYDRVDDVQMDNGDVYGWQNVQIEAVPAYNIIHKNNGVPYHPKGVGNGYVLRFGDFAIYLAGDTEPIPEMTDLEDIDVAFLPKNLPYTMDDEQFVEAAKAVAPKILYPYHFSEIDREKLRRRLPEIRIQ